MSGLRFVALGVGDAFSARHYSSCLAVEAEGAWLLVDCPHPIRKVLREASATAGEALDINRFAGIALTHLHADHSSGLETFGFFCRFVLDRRAQVLAHPSVSERLWDGHLAAGMERSLQHAGGPVVARSLGDFFHVTPLSESSEVQFGPFSIQCRTTVHNVPTTALRISAGGRCLGCSADTAFDPGLIEWLAQADLIVHESGPGFLHTPYERLAALPAALRERMLLIHYPDDFDVEASVIDPLRQGRCYVV